MKKKPLHRISSLLAATVLGLFLLTGCAGKSAEAVQAQEDADTIQVYLWSNSLYEKYAPYVQAHLPDVNIEFIVGNNDLDFYKFLQENGGLPDIITCCRFSLHDAAPLKDSLMDLSTTNEAGAVYNSMSVAQFRKWIETGSIPKSVLEKKKKESEKVCPLCGGALVLRVAKFGPKPGSRFYGCKNFPDCHYTEPYEEEKAKEDN